MNTIFSYPNMGKFTVKRTKSVTTVTFADGITIDYEGDKATVWSADGDYDAVYNADNEAGITQEIKFLRIMENGFTVTSGSL